MSILPRVVTRSKLAGFLAPLSLVTLVHAAAGPLGDVPSTARRQLSSAEVVATALAEVPALRFARRDFALRAQSIESVSRRQFLPKLSTTAGVQRSADDLAGIGVGSQYDVTLAADWRLSSGTAVRLSRQLLAASGVDESGVGGQVTAVSLHQPLLRGASGEVVQAELTLAELAYESAKTDLRQTALQVISDAVGAYVDAQQAQSAVEQAASSLELTERVHAFNRAMVDAGRSPRNVLVQSELDVSYARLGLQRAQLSLATRVRLLARAMGTEGALDERGVELTDSPDRLAERLFVPSDSAVASIVAASADIVAARRTLDAAEVQAHRAADDLLPSLSVSAGLSKVSSRWPAQRQQRWSVGLQFSYEFDDAPRVLARRSAVVAVDNAREMLSRTLRQVKENADEVVQSLASHQAQRDIARRSLELADQQLELELTRQRFGKVDQIDLSRALQARTLAEQQLRTAEVDVVRTLLELGRLSGRLLGQWHHESLVDTWIGEAERRASIGVFDQ